MAKTVLEKEFTANPVRLYFPDVARGLMLLSIAGANATTAWVKTEGAEMAAPVGGVYDNSLLDRIAVVFGCMFFHVRGLPMFATMLGIGIGMIATSLARREYPRFAAQRVLARRYGFLALFGAIHMIFLFTGDIMLFYGLAGLVLALVIGFRDKILLWTSGIMWGISFLISILMFALDFTSEDFSGKNYADLMGSISGSSDGSASQYFNQIHAGLFSVPVSFIGLPFELMVLGLPILLGYLAAKRDIIHRIDEHRTLLWCWVATALVIILGLGLPLGLAEIQVIGGREALSELNQTLGMLTGPGIVAGLALALNSLQRRATDARARGGQVRTPAVLWPLIALGKRSMSGYVGQSVLFSILVMDYGLGLTQNSGAWKITLMSVFVWGLTVLGACLCEALGKPGPLEWLHRHLSYGKKGLHSQYPREALPTVSTRGYPVYPGNSTAPQRERDV